jgi:hypothetical protein
MGRRIIFPSLAGFDRVDLRHIPGLHGNHARLRNVEVRELIQRRRRSVIIHLDAVQNVDGRASGAQRGQFVLEIGDGLFHA